MWRTSMPSDDDSSWEDGRRPAHSSPYCRSRKNSSVSREERGRAYRTDSPAPVASESITRTASLVWLPEKYVWAVSGRNR